jgi:twitching motility protein PilT
MKLHDVLKITADRGASDLHLKVGSPPTIRIDGILTPLELDKLMPDMTESLVLEMLPARYNGHFPTEGSLDFAYGVANIGRFRVNAFRQRGTISAVLRRVSSDILNYEQLNLPPVIQELARKDRGLVLVTGITGSGKSTTLAAMLDDINHRRSAHVVTIEDPIEYLYRDDKCLINQRELGIDFDDFADALKRVLRQDPDIILIGEMRDKETIISAVKAAETGHLVFSTLHTSDSAQTVDRIMKYFDPSEQELIRMQLALNLQGVVSQRLLRRASGQGRVPAVEILINTPVVQKLILEGRTKELKAAVKNKEGGMQTFDQCLLEYVNKEIVTKEEALRAVDNQGAFIRMLKGGWSDSDHGGILGV